MMSGDAGANTQPFMQIQNIRGFPFPNNRLFHKENIEAALDFQPRDTDIFISTFPKCGTNWVKYIVYTILTNGQKPLSYNGQLNEASPFLEMSGTAITEIMSDPRPLACHLPYHLIPKNPRAKYIYVIRNPKDAVVSYYHFIKPIRQVHVDFDTYFEAFLKGSVSYGDYFDHVLSWYEHKDDPNVLIMSYEQLHYNIRDQILNIAKFLGGNYHEALLQDEDLMDLVVKQTSFAEMMKLMKERPSKNDNNEQFKPTNSTKLFRKGIVGDWKNYFSPEQNNRMEERIKEKFGNTDIIEMFNPLE